MNSKQQNGPPKKMAKLDKKETNPCLRAVLTQDKELGKLLTKTADFCKERPEIQRWTSRLFASLADSFTDLLNDNSVKEWTLTMHENISFKCEKLVELCVLKTDEDAIVVFDPLAVVLNPNTKFHEFNATRQSKSVLPGRSIPEDKLYARPPSGSSNPRGWLVDVINRFGEIGGFLVLLSRFQPGRRSPTIPMIRALLRPFALCHELLTMNTIVKYFMPIVERVRVIFDGLTNKELKEEGISLQINQDLSGTIEDMKILVSRVPGSTKIIQNLESLKIRTIFRFLLNASDIKESVRNLDLHLNIEQWNYLMEYFQTSWKTESDQIREKMLEVIRRWVRDPDEDESGVMSTPVGCDRVVAVLWDLAHSDELSTEMMEKVLSVQADIIIYCVTYNDGDEAFAWIDKCVEELKSSDKWAMTAMRQISNISDAFENKGQHYILCTDSFFWHLSEEHNFFTFLINNLTDYMNKTREFVRENPQFNENYPEPVDGRYYHGMQIFGRLDILSNLIRSDSSPPEIEQLKQIWECLVENSIYDSDRNDGFKWFIEIIKDTHCISDRAVIRNIFEQIVLQLDLKLLTCDGMLCFQIYFIEANKEESNKFKLNNLIGKDYLWRVVTNCPEDIARDGFELLNQMNQNVGSQLELSVSDIHKNFIAECKNQLQVYSDSVLRLVRVGTIEHDYQRKKNIANETQKMNRVMTFLGEYTEKCGWDEN